VATPGIELQLDLEADDPFADQLDADLLFRVVERALLAEGIVGAVEVTLVIVDDEEIRALNDAHRGIDEPTDVLSFPLEDSPLGGPGALSVSPRFVTPPEVVRHLGDVVISYPRAEAQAREYGHSIRRELAFLTVHGCLHLLGYDHEEAADREAMRAREEAALAEVPRES
jgi:probable rRNA maturation factor